MARPALEVADLFRGHGAAWRHANRGHVSLLQLKVRSIVVVVMVDVFIDLEDILFRLGAVERHCG
jgi:hypothetical protein